MKKLTALLMSLVMVAAMTACGGSSTPAAASTPAEVPAASSQSEAAPAAPELSGSMNVVCTSESYKTIFDKFTEETGVKVDFLSMSSGEVLSKINAEGGSTSSDLWFGGGIDSFMEAKDKGYLDQMTFDALSDLAPQYKDADNYWIAKGLTVAGFVVNNSLMKEQNLEIPQSWADLAKPEYKGEVLMSNPAISGTNYAVVNAMLQKLGDEAGWAYWESLNENIDYYSRRGSDPLNKTAAGEVAIGIAPLDRKAEKIAEEQDLTIVYPQDGVPYMPEGVAVFKDSPNAQNAHAFVEWLISSDENMVLLSNVDGKDTCKAVKPNINGVELTFDVGTLIEVDLSLYGSQRTELLEKWNVMMGDKAEEAS